MLKGRLGLETARVPQADRHGVLWLRRGNLFVESGTLQWVTGGDEELPAGSYGIPYQSISAILLQPGSTVSHDALRILASHGTGLVFVGEDGVRFYASMPKGPDRSARARQQALAWADEKKRIEVARKMYAWRLGELLPTAEITVLRGIEGARTKEMYRRLGEQFGVTWRGRRYDRASPDLADVPNQTINHVSTVCRACASVATAVAGAIPQLGFIHEDSGMSFDLDIADLFRDSFTVPVAFAAAREWTPNETIERTTRRLAGREVRKQKLVARMIDRIKELFDGDDGRGDEERS